MLIRRVGTPTRGVRPPVSNGQVRASSTEPVARCRGTRDRCHGSLLGAAHDVGSMSLYVLCPDHPGSQHRSWFRETEVGRSYSGERMARISGRCAESTASTSCSAHDCKQSIAMRRASFVHPPAAALARQSRCLSRASHLKTLSQMPTDQPVKVERAHRCCTVQLVLHCVAIFARCDGSTHLPSNDHSTHIASRSIFKPCSFSHASHWLRQVASINAGFREHSPCAAYPSHSRFI